MAARRRGGLLPQASVSPAQMRATRDLRWRRRPLAHKRAERLAHVQPTNRQYTLPAIGNKLASKAHREGVAERVAAPAGQTSLAVDLALITSYDERLRDVELTRVTTAPPLMPPPGMCCNPCPVWAHCSASCCSTHSPRSPASPGGRMLVPRAAWSHVPGHPPANVRARPAPQSAPRLSHGPLRKPPSWASEPLHQPSNTSPAWSKTMTKARPSPSWPNSERALSMTCAHARWLARGRRASSAKGGERRRLAPHGTPMGCACPRRPSMLPALRPCTPRPLEGTRP